MLLLLESLNCPDQITWLNIEYFQILEFHQILTGILRDRKQDQTPIAAKCNLTLTKFNHVGDVIIRQAIVGRKGL